MKRFLQPSSAISLSRFFVCLITLGVAGTMPSLASIDVGDYNGGGPATVSAFSDGDTLDGTSTANNSDNTFSGNITNLATGTINLSHTDGLQTWNGTATLVNEGTLNWSSTVRGAISHRSGNMVFRNEGLIDAQMSSSHGGNNGNYYSNVGNVRFINAASGIFRITTAQTFKWEWPNANARIYCEGGTWDATNSGTLNIGGGSTSGILSSEPTSTFVQHDGTVRPAGNWSNLFGVAVGARLGAGTISAISGGTEINITGEGFEWRNGAAMNPGSHVLTLSGDTLATHPGSTKVGGGSGHVRNTGHLTATTGDLGFDMQNNSEFRNAGIFEITESTGNRDVYARNAGVVFYNEATGVITQDATSASFGFGDGVAGATFRNAGTIYAAGNQTFNVAQETWVNDASTVSSGDLLEGTWICDGGSINLPGSNLDTIDTNARVVLAASGSFSDITAANFVTLNGTFGLWRGRTWDASSGLTAGSSANFEFGLDNSGTDAYLEISGASTVDGVVDVIDLDGDVSQGSYVVITNSGGTTLTDSGIAAGTLTTVQNLNLSITVYAGANGYVEVSLTPPPTGAVLFVE